MAWLSLGISAIWGVFGVGLRSRTHKRRTGRSPLRHGAGPGGVLALAGLVIAYTAGPLDEIAFDAKPLVRNRFLAAAGLTTTTLALGLLLGAQASMGDSLRIGVDPHERTDLVTDGAFRWVRNPIYSAMFAYMAGTVMLVPNPVTLVCAAGLVVGEELQVRRVEEPHLRAVHGAEYERYAATVGRFVPRVGTLTSWAAKAVSSPVR